MGAMPITSPGPDGGQFSTIILSNGAIETILFDSNNEAVLTRRTYGVGAISDRHRKEILDEIGARS